MERIPHRKRYGRFTRLRTFSPKFEVSRRRSWQHKTVWALFGLLLFVVAVLAVVNQVEWLLIVAWPPLLLSVWITTRDIQSRRVRWTVVMALVAVAGIGCYMARPSQDRGQVQDRSQISDAELCSQTTALTQRMREFEHQRWAQHDKSVDQFRASMAKAASKQEQERIRRQSNAELNSFLDAYQGDFDRTFRAEAKRLRSELLMRLPEQERRQAKANEIFFEGRLVGAYPVERLANLLSDLVKRVCRAS